MPLNYATLMSTKFAPLEQVYTRRDVMLYALGLGVASSDPLDPQELKYVYERNLVALPTLAVVLGLDAAWFAEPQYGITFHMILHAEQTLNVHRPLPVEGTVVSEQRIAGAFDKGKERGALLDIRRELYDTRTGDHLATLGHLMFLRADGGFGGESGSGMRPLPVRPDRPPDLQLPLLGRADQALIYRLSGDYNPLHADPKVAQRAGFERPILHGLSAYGMVGRALLKALCGDDPTRMRGLDVRFTSPVYPGEPLRIDAWRTGPGKVAFRLIASGRNVVVEDFGEFRYAETAA